MEKTKLVNIIEKYHLNKLIESGRWDIKDNTLHLKFCTKTKDVAGFLTTPFQIEDASIGIHGDKATSELLRLVNITDDTLLVTFQKHNNIPIKLNIEDNNFSLFYSLSDPILIETIESVNEPPSPITTIDIQEDFIVKYLRAKKALSDDPKVKICLGYNDQQEKVTWFTLGSELAHANKIKFSTYCDFENNVYEDITFNGDVLREILSTNKQASSIKLTLWQEGIMKLDIVDEDITVTYYLIGLQ